MKGKAWLFVAVMLLAVLAIGTVFAKEAPGGELLPIDAGNYNDYGGGDSGWSSGGSDWGGGSDWSSSWDDDWDSDYSSSGSGFIFFDERLGALVVVIVTILLFVYVSRKTRKAPGRAGNHYRGAVPQVLDHTQEIERAILAVDPLFNKEKFLAWSKEVYVTLQQAWMERDWSKIRPFEKEELFAQHQKLLQEYIDQGRINVMERINVNQAFLQKYERDPQYEYLTVYLQARMRDYIIDEKTRQVLMGNPDADCYMQYLMKFTRKNGVKTDPAAASNIVACPHCGAPTQITSAGKCEYCGFIVTTGDYDWVLCDMQAVKPGVIVDNSGVILRDNQ